MRVEPQGGARGLLGVLQPPTPIEHMEPPKASQRFSSMSEEEKEKSRRKKKKKEGGRKKKKK